MAVDLHKRKNHLGSQSTTASILRSEQNGIKRGSPWIRPNIHLFLMTVETVGSHFEREMLWD